MWKLVILLLWLSIPAGGYVLFRADYARYQRDCEAQRQECLTRGDIIARYSTYFERQARQIPAVDDRYSRFDWEREWERLQSALAQEYKGLRAVPPGYFPRSDAALIAAEQALKEQQQSAEQAAKQRRYAQDIRQGLAELEQSIYEVRAAAEYYRRAGSDTIYIYLQEELAQREDVYYARMREHDMFLDNSATALAKASRLGRDAQRATALLAEELKLDAARTYREELRQRFVKFDLGQQLGLLLSDLI